MEIIMFTGLIEEIGEIKIVKREGKSARIFVRTSLTLERGASIAVDGVCITVEKIDRDGFWAFLSEESIKRTRFKFVLKPGIKVNLERPLTLADRLGGHLVLGHVDTTGIIASIKRKGSGVEMEFKLKDKCYAKFLVEKGSVAVNGISLTCFNIKDDSFKVALIPETLKKTNLGFARVGEPVNLEFDIIGKYVENMIKGRRI